MMNKGRIYGDLGEFFRFSWNSIKSDDKFSWKIMYFSISRNKTLKRIQEIKNHSIWINICREIKK